MNELREKLENIKLDIIDKKKKYIKLSMDKKEINKALSGYTREIKKEIAEAEDSKGKLLYSNQQKRDTAFAEKMENDKEYNKVIEKIDKIDKKMKDLEIDIEELKYDFKIEDILTRGDN